MEADEAAGIRCQVGYWAGGSCAEKSSGTLHRVPQVAGSAVQGKNLWVSVSWLGADFRPRETKPKTNISLSIIGSITQQKSSKDIGDLNNSINPHDPMVREEHCTQGEANSQSFQVQIKYLPRQSIVWAITQVPISSNEFKPSRVFSDHMELS